MSDDRPIGIFDSGLGGLTVCREVFACMPGEKICYLGDTARVPYGNRSPEVIRRFARQDARFLLSKDIKLLIVACNTVSSVALEVVQEEAGDIPVIGVVLPGAKAALKVTAQKKIGVIGTRATVRSESYVKALHQIDRNATVVQQACPLFVPIAEEGLGLSDIARMAAQQYLFPMVDSGIDALILGCTHYPILMEVIQETVGTQIQLVDSALWTAREGRDILAALSALAKSATGGYEQSTFFVTDLSPTFTEVAGTFLGRPLPSIDKVTID